MTDKAINGWTTTAAACGLALAILISAAGVSQAQTNFEMCQPGGYGPPTTFTSQETQVTFELSRNFKSGVSVFRIDMAGKAKNPSLLFPGRRVTLKTYKGNRWLVHNGTACAYFEIDTTPKKIFID